jgi:methyltransferase (TIGR00027 family)
MAAVCSHSDESRSRVSTTAHGVALGRSMEPILHPEDPWFVDPYAAALAGDVAKEVYQDSWLNGKNKDEGTEEQRKEHVKTRLNVMAARTKCIDDFMLDCLNEGVRQIVVFGAGLCTRAWRLQPRTPKDYSIKYIEVDFQEVFAYKLAVLSEQGAKTVFEYKDVVADLSLPSWPQQLQSAGYDASLPTLFVMEGFVNYLKESELSALFHRLSTIVNEHTKMILTCASTAPQEERSFNGTLGLHQFHPADPLAYFSGFGWQGRQDDIAQLARAYGRDAGELKGYMMLKLTRDV